MMKAILFSGKDKPLTIGTAPVPEPGENEVLIRLHYAALNHIDLWRIKEQPGLPGGPVILGSDGAGIIESVGQSVQDFKPGQQVMINPGWGWGSAIQAPDSAFRILGYPDNGTFAEYIVAGQQEVFPVPSHLSLEEAAAIPLAGITAYRALFTRGGIRRGQHVLITGIGGGVAQFLLQFAVSEGARVFVTSGQDEKISLAIKQGAQFGFNYTNKTRADEVKQSIPQGFDLVVDSAAGDEFPNLIEWTKNGGSIVLYGRTAGIIPALAPGKLFYKQINILGTTMGSPREFRAMLDYYERRQLHPVIDSVFRLDDFHRAIERLNRGEQVGKILLDCTGTGSGKVFKKSKE